MWLYLASNLSMRLHGVHSFNAYPYVVRFGGMLAAFGPEVGHKAVHPESRDVTLSCQGFNDKNSYDRQTPCDQDFLRKLARDTAPEQLEAWFSHEVMGTLKQHRAFDAEGIFLGDASWRYLELTPHRTQMPPTIVENPLALVVIPSCYPKTSGARGSYCLRCSAPEKPFAMMCQILLEWGDSRFI